MDIQKVSKSELKEFYDKKHLNNLCSQAKDGRVFFDSIVPSRYEWIASFNLDIETLVLPDRIVDRIKAWDDLDNCTFIFIGLTNGGLGVLRQYSSLKTTDLAFDLTPKSDLSINDYRQSNLKLVIQLLKISSNKVDWVKYKDDKEYLEKEL